MEKELQVVRKELKNLRQELCKLKALQEKEVKSIKCHLEKTKTFDSTHNISAKEDDSKTEFGICPIGFIESCFKTKNGTPRQPSVCPMAKACLRIDKTVFCNPEHSLIGLEEFSHIWILFIFHKNGPKTGKATKFKKAKVHPPRLNGKSVGVFSTRSPHRPNAIGLSLSRLEKIEGDVLYLSCIDLLDGTPVVDIKPFIPSYDTPLSSNIPKDFMLSDISETTLSKHEHTHQLSCQHISKFSKDSVLDLNTSDIIKEGRKCNSSWKNNCDIEKYKTCKFSYDISSGEQNCTEKENQCICMQSENLVFDTDKSNNIQTKVIQSRFLNESQCSGQAISLSFPNRVESPLCNKTFLDCNKYHSVLNDSPVSTCMRNKETIAIRSKNTEKPVKTFCDQHIEYAECTKDGISVKHDSCNVASWLAMPPIPPLNVIFTKRAETSLRMFHRFQIHCCKCEYCLDFLLGPEEAKIAITNLLQTDPRSVYRRQKCTDRLYYFSIDAIHATCWFDESLPMVEILKIKPMNGHSLCNNLVGFC